MADWLRTSSFQHLTGPLCAIGQSQTNNLIVSREFDLEPRKHNPTVVLVFIRLTFSKMTKGPLIPPMVLYLILGVTLYDDDSLGSPMVADCWIMKMKRRLELSDRRKLQGDGENALRGGELRCWRGWRASVAFGGAELSLNVEAIAISETKVERRITCLEAGILAA
jgi:hypothetical protein